MMTLSPFTLTRPWGYTETVYSSPGTATLYGHTSKPSETNVATKATNQLVSKILSNSDVSKFASTGTGSPILITSTSHLSSMEVTPVWVATASSLHTTEVLLVPGQSPSPLEKEADV
jgi:hypothetical protein